MDGETHPTRRAQAIGASLSPRELVKIRQHWQPHIYGFFFYLEIIKLSRKQVISSVLMRQHDVLLLTGECAKQSRVKFYDELRDSFL